MKNRLLTLSQVAQKRILLTYLIVTPMAMTLNPPASFYGSDYTVDEIIWVRIIIILSGALATILSALCTTTSLILNRKDYSTLMWHCSATLLAVAMGFRYLPYCANGIFQAYLTGAEIIDIYPGKIQIFSSSFGDYWALIQIANWYGYAILATLVACKRHVIEKDRFKEIVYILGATMLTYIFSPHLSEWMFD